MPLNLTTRAAKGAPLTHPELDANFTNTKNLVDQLETEKVTPEERALWGTPSKAFRSDVNFMGFTEYQEYFFANSTITAVKPGPNISKIELALGTNGYVEVITPLANDIAVNAGAVKWRVTFTDPALGGSISYKGTEL